MLLTDLPYRLAQAPASSVAGPPLADDPVLALDGAGMISGCTPAVEALFNRSHGELIGRQVSALIPELEGAKLVRGGQLSLRLHLLSCAHRVFRQRRATVVSLASLYPITGWALHASSN